MRCTELSKTNPFPNLLKSTNNRPHHFDMNDDTIEDQKPTAMNIATISAGFEKGDFLVREEQGNRVYFDFFEEVCLSRGGINTELHFAITCSFSTY